MERKNNGGIEMLREFFSRNNDVLAFSARIFASALVAGCVALFAIEKLT